MPTASRVASAPWLLGITLAAVLVRTWTMLESFDVPGDGPTRAAAAFAWVRSPHLPTCGAWPPGHLVVAGVWSAIVGTPLWFARLLNVILGALSVPLLAGVATVTWDRRVGLAAAAALAVLPLHVELSASGLTEPMFLCELLLGWRLLLRYVDGRDRISALLGAGASITLAEATRYEGWLLGALLLAWGLRVASRTRDRVVLGVLVLAFPIAWTIGNAQCGDALAGFRAAVQEPGAGGGYTLLTAASYLLALGLTELGAPLLVLAVVGVGMETVAALRRGARMERRLALAMAALVWLMLARFTMSRGASAWNRYALTAFVLALPFAFVPLRAVRGTLAATVLVLLLTAASFAPALLSGVRETRWIRSAPPRAAADLAAWRTADPARRDLFIVSTSVGWELTFLPLFDPATFQQLWTVSSWVPDGDLARGVANLRGRAPFFFVTRPGDEADVARLEQAAGVSLTASAPIFTTGALQIRLVRIPGLE